jgi:predicted Zn finger-like uncharacterized protein
MHIVCPHCTTSYAVGPSALGETGRNVRCARCKQVWFARPEDAVAEARVPLMAGSAPPPEDQAPPAPRAAQTDDWQDQNAPMVESPSITSDLPETEEERALRRKQAAQAEWAALAQQDEEADIAPPPPRARKKAKRKLALSLPSWMRKPAWLRMPAFVAKIKVPAWVPRPKNPFAKLPQPFRTIFSLPMVTAAMGSLVIALVIWRADVVKLMPQTADFFKLVGLEVNLRGLAIKEVKIGSETVDGKPVLVIEGAVIGQSKRSVEVPRLRFVVRDGKGTEIYAWNAVLEQATLYPGEKLWFRSRLASPPPEARAIDVRFFTRRDLAAGGA